MAIGRKGAISAGGVLAGALVAALVLSKTCSSEVFDESDGSAFARETVTDLGTAWQFDALRARAFSGWLAVVNPVAMQAQLDCFQRQLGKLVEIEGVTRTGGDTMGPGGLPMQSDFDIHAKFDLGDAQIRLRVMRPSGEWRVGAIRIEPSGAAACVSA